jgi:tetratricopeptide (TPR) repeat protein
MRPQILAWISLILALTIVGAEGHGAYHDVLAEFDKHIARDPTNVDLLVRRARLHLSHEEWASALIDLERVDRLETRKVSTDGLRGQALNQGRQWGGALYSLNAHLRLEPTDSDALFERGRARFHLGDLNAADDYRESFKAEATSAPAPERVLEAADVIRRRDGAQGAAGFIEKIIADHRASADPSVVERAMNLALECSSYDAALKHIAALQQLAPRAERWMARRAEVLAMAGRAAEAKSAWIALRDRLLALPNLERGVPAMQELMAAAERSLGIVPMKQVIAPPAAPPVSSTNVTSTPNAEPST